MKIICDKKKCTGCGACYNICPKNAINMVENEEGFLYPEVDIKKCVNCDLCENICPIKNKRENIKFDLETYAVVNKNEEILLNSSSGGVFTIIAEKVLEKNGYVYGCVYDKDFKVNHKYIKSKDELRELRGSKYVQSNLKDTYKDVKKQLENNQYVLYTGTPCQIAGLRAYLKKEYDKLLTIDLICHGVPSQKIFDEYLKYISNGEKIKDFKFRDKNKYDSNIQILSYIKNGKKFKIKNFKLDPYYNAFFNNMIFRESCYECEYANINRIGDFTLGDFWGAENYHKELTNKKGVSAVMINTEKAKQFFEKYILSEILYVKTNIDYVKQKNHNLNSPNIRPQEREHIYRDLNLYGFKYITKRYLRPKNYYMTKLKSYIPVDIKRKITKLLNYNKNKKLYR